MATWAAVQGLLGEKYQVHVEGPDHLSMVWAYDDGRSQRIDIRRFVAFDREMVELQSAFARRDELEPEAMLRKSAELPLATVALVGDRYCAVYNLPIEHLASADLEFYVSRVAAVADALEERLAHHDVF